MNLALGQLLAAYRSGETKPSTVVERVAKEIRHAGERPVWISTTPVSELQKRAAELEADPDHKKLPLYGVPFAVKDNIDVAGVPTTAGCPSFAYTPERSATVVERLTAAGAIVMGKTNLDQFATGLVGVRSPYGACSSVFDQRYVSGGSSSGSAVAVARGLACFSLGTDTAGSGRVPAAFNGLVGMKPTRGVFSMSGVVPACRSLDCVSVFAGSAAEAAAVWRVAQGYDASDFSSRAAGPGDGASPWVSGATFRFGVPKDSQLEFFGDTEAAKLFAAAVEQAKALGGVPVEIDYSVYLQSALLLYAGPWVAERYAALEGFLKDHAEDVHPVVRQIVMGATKYSAAEAYKAQYRLGELRRQAAGDWARMDVMLLPTTGTTYTIAEVEADPIKLNSNLGYYTNFVNLMDLAAMAVPAGRRPNGLPFGVTFIGPAFSDAALLQLAARFGGETAAVSTRPATGCIEVAVVGAHLNGQPLNRELTERGARLVKTCKTDRAYRFYHLKDTVPTKPGLVWEAGFQGPGIEVEIWAVPSDQFGSFVAGVPAPLGIGNAKMEDGEWVKCFICEPYAVAGSREITAFGGWRGYLASR
ncbi:MAG: allophanate hydrolase [Bryobacterales bacterium]|nr:allophanate hydrolase [Bryobacterales bacterium]